VLEQCVDQAIGPDGGPSGVHHAGMRPSLFAIVVLAACSNSCTQKNSAIDAAATGSDGAATGDGAVEDLDMQASDFECVLRWTMVGGYRITNKLGHDALAIAQSPTGGTFPVGTIIQIVPTEAMVKRRSGFSSMTNDWEFFALGVSGKTTTINTRGTTDVINAFGGNCLTCHMKAMPQYDMVCSTTHGCDPLPLSETQLVNIQSSDSRCP
jgi:hypothetical protein